MADSLELTLPVLASYCLTMMLGIAARYRGRSFGRWHHGFFALTCMVFIVSILFNPHLAHIPVATVLAALPLTRPRRSRRHDAVALAGFVCLIVLVAIS